MPSLRALLMMRQAISPRLAMRIFLNMRAPGEGVRPPPDDREKHRTRKGEREPRTSKPAARRRKVRLILRGHCYSRAAWLERKSPARGIVRPPPAEDWRVPIGRAWSAST